PGPPPAEGHHRDTNLAGRDSLHDAGPLRMDGAHDGSLFEMTPWPYEQILRAAQGCDNPLKVFGSLPGCDRVRDSAAGVVQGIRYLAENKHFGRKSDRDFVKSGLPF